VIVRFKVRISDRYAVRSDKHPYQVRIEHEDGELVVVPLRGVTKSEAERSMHSLLYAFEFGLNAMIRSLASVRFSVEEQRDG